MQQEFYYVECRLLSTTLFRFQLKLPMAISNTGFRSVRDAYLFCDYVFENNREYKVVV
jgi:hypothetical protein